MAAPPRCFNAVFHTPHPYTSADLGIPTGKSERFYPTWDEIRFHPTKVDSGFPVSKKKIPRWSRF